MHDLARKPGPALGAAPDHDAVGAGGGERRARVLEADDIAVDHDRDAHRLLDPAHEIPIGGAVVELAAGAAVHRDHANAARLGDARQLRRVAAGLVPAGAHLERDREVDRRDRGLHDAPGQVGFAHQRRAGGLVDHLLDRTTEVDVDQRRAAVGIEPRRLGHDFGLAAGQLHRHGEDLGAALGQLHRLPGLADHGLAGDHLRDHQPGAEALDQAPERQVRDPGHRGQDHRLGDLQGSNLDAHILGNPSAA
jgi:hypothetical protein